MTVDDLYQRKVYLIEAESLVFGFMVITLIGLAYLTVRRMRG